MSFTDIGSDLSSVTRDFGIAASSTDVTTVSSGGLFDAEPLPIDSSNPERLYRIGFAAAANLSVNIGQLTNNADLGVIYDANNNRSFDAGEEIASSRNPGTTSESIGLVNLNPGSYYIYVRGADPVVQTAFSLGISYTVGFPVGTPISAGSPLDSITTDWGTNPTSFGAGGFLGTERLDRVQFTRPTDLQLNFNSSGTVNMQIIRDADADGIFDAGESVANTTNSPLALSNLPPDTYYIHLYRTQSTVQPFQATYLFSASESTTPTTDDTLASARSLTLGTATQDAVSSTDSNDFYRFTVNQSGIFTANLTGLSGDADVRLIQDKNGNGAIDPAQVYNFTTGQLDPGEILAWQWERGTQNETLRRFLEPGTYYVQVNSYNNQSANYTLGTAFTAATSDPNRFTITPVYDGNLNATARATVQKAIDFWQNIILSVDPNAGTVRLPQNLTLPFRLAISSIDGGTPINGGSGGFSWNSNNGIVTWTAGKVAFGSIYLDDLNNQPNLDPSLVIHEIGHALGLVNTRPGEQNLSGPYPANSYASQVYGELLGTFVPTSIPVDEDIFGSYHWSEAVLDYETMTPTSNLGVNSLSQLSIAALRDVGWNNILNLNFGAAQPYVLPIPGLAVGSPIGADLGNLTFAGFSSGYNYTLNGTVADTNFNDIWSVTLRPTDNRLKVDFTAGNASLRVIDDRNKNGIFDVGEEVARLTDSSVPQGSNVYTVDTNGRYYIVAYQTTAGQTNSFNLRVESFTQATRGLVVGEAIEVDRGNLNFVVVPPGNFYVLNGTVSNTNFNEIWSVTPRSTDNRLRINFRPTGDADLRLINDRNRNSIFDSGEEVANLTSSEERTFTIESNGSYYIVVYQVAPGQDVSFNNSQVESSAA